MILITSKTDSLNFFKDKRLQSFKPVSLSRQLEQSLLTPKISEKTGKPLKALTVNKNSKVKDALIQWLTPLNARMIGVSNPTLTQYLTGFSPAFSEGAIIKWERWLFVIFPPTASYYKNELNPMKYAAILRKLNQRPITIPFKFTLISSPAQLESFIDTINQDNDILIACDIETGGKAKAPFISSISYSWFSPSHPTNFGTICIPFFVFGNNCRGKGYWTREQEAEIWTQLKRLHYTPTNRFITHNGNYDYTYLFINRLHTANPFADTQHLKHTIQPEDRKSLRNTASLYCINYLYWKDEITGGEDNDNSNKDITHLPRSPQAFARYWRYNGLDTYFTLSAFIAMLCSDSIGFDSILKTAQKGWDLQLLYLMMGLLGMKTDPSKWTDMIKNSIELRDSATALIKYLTSNPSFNPNSDVDKKNLFYSALQARPVYEDEYSVDLKMLSIVKYQHPMIELFFNILKQISKHETFLSVYPTWEADNMIGDRSIFSMASSGTNTFRASSSSNSLWIGRNMQNIEAAARPAFVAPDGYFMFDIDYCQSDNYFVAYESGDKQCIYNTAEDKRDTHSLHAAFYFNKTYEEIFNDPNKKARTSLRSSTKSIHHGNNYLMTAPTMKNYITAMCGLEAFKGMGEGVGIRTSATPSDAECLAICKRLQERYALMYPDVVRWQRGLESEYLNQSRKPITSCFNYVRPFNGQNCKSTMGKIASFYGQGGTAGNINRTLYEYFYGELPCTNSLFRREPFEWKGDKSIDFNAPSLYSQGLRITLQVHDSLVGYCPIDKPFLVEELMRLMSKPVMIKGRLCSVPVEADAGDCWSKQMIDFFEYKKKLS